MSTKMTTTNMNAQSISIRPLETLVVQQLAEMLDEERMLQERYRRLGGSNRRLEEMDSFSVDLSKFNERAVRLFRMMEAMEGCYSTSELQSGSAFISAQ
jgi:hypothetical protein